MGPRLRLMTSRNPNKGWNTIWPPSDLGHDPWDLSTSDDPFMHFRLLLGGWVNSLDHGKVASRPRASLPRLHLLFSTTPSFSFYFFTSSSSSSSHILVNSKMIVENKLYLLHNPLFSLLSPHRPSLSLLTLPPPPHSPSPPPLPSPHI